VVVVVEAMKAQHDIRSPYGGRVERVHVRVGDEVDSAKPLVTVG
jgi:biotin carboxyl carrier protein